MEMTTLCWLAEEACLNAWPAPRSVMVEGWLLRAAGGTSRRVNSVNPLRHGPEDPSAVVAACEAIYASLGQTAIFRVPDIVPGMDGPLAKMDYAIEGETCTVFADLSVAQETRRSHVELTAEPTAEWLATRARLNDADAAASRFYENILGCLVGKRAFAATLSGGIVSIAFGVIHRGLLVLESVTTDPLERRRGRGADIVSALMSWARAHGAWGACLQVAADNIPALALYRSLGFGAELYRYHYRCKHGGA